MNHLARTPAESLVDQADLRCSKCGTPRGGCDCWTPCRCGWIFETGQTCSNPVHAAERTAAEAARAAAGSIIVDMRQRYPEPMGYASGGFQKTLRGLIEEEVARALPRADGRLDEEKERAATAETVAAISRFRCRPGDSA